jgi:hypothetical protein
MGEKVQESRSEASPVIRHLAKGNRFAGLFNQAARP